MRHLALIAALSFCACRAHSPSPWVPPRDRADPPPPPEMMTVAPSEPVATPEQTTPDPQPVDAATPLPDERAPVESRRQHYADAWRHADPIPASQLRRPGEPRREAKRIKQVWSAPSHERGPASPPAETDYALVTLSGSFKVEYDGIWGSVCGSPTPADVKPEREQVVFYNEEFDTEGVRRVVVTNLWDKSLCGLTFSEVWVGRAEGPEGFDITIPPLGEVRVEFTPGGEVTIRTNKARRTLAPGQRVTLTISGRDFDRNRARGEFTFHHRGHWPRAGIQIVH